MAARQDQTLVIALIVFVCIAVIGLAWGYLMFKSSGDAHKQITDLQQKLQNEKEAVRTNQQENESYRRYIGLGEHDNYDVVKETYDEDMAKYGSTFDESRHNYRDILGIIYEENEKIALREADAKEQLRQLKERLLAVENEKEQQVQQYQAQMKKAETDAASQRKSFAEDRSKLETTKQELTVSMNEQKQYYQKEKKQLDTKIEELTTRLDNSERAKKKLLDERAKGAESFEVPDGLVSWVNQNRTIWINLGAADALRPQVTFSVYDATLSDPAKAEKKGSIEVTRILGDHIAEARVTSDNLIDPILSGDHVYSQVWHRGKKLRFALTGFIDIDDDGTNDVDKAIELIEFNGGEVDSYLDKDGALKGDMTIDTRYLVLGEFPEDSLKAAFREGWSRMTKEADDKGVEEITLVEFLNRMGYTPDERTVKLGVGARSGDFVASPDQLEISPNSNRFRPRRTPYRLPGKVPY